MLKTTVGQLLINDSLPADMQDYGRKLDKKGTGQLFQDIAAKYPEKYKDIAKRLSDVGRQAATESGGYSFGLDSLQPPEKIRQMKAEMLSQVDQILRNGRLDDSVKREHIIHLMQSKTKEMETTLYAEATKDKNPLAMQVLSGARGNPGNLRSVLGGDLLYEDHRGHVIPIPVLHSYSQGLSPVEYWAGTFGTRKGVADLKFATQDAGYFGKQLNQVTHRLIISADDEAKYDGTLRGIPVPTDDPDNEGAYLAHDIAGFKRNTQLTPKVLSEIKAKGNEKILIRSPLVGGHPDGGLYAYDVGVRERGGRPAKGDNVGMAAAQSISEPLVQAQISSKHQGGVAGAGGTISGFKFINQLVQVPKTFAGGATHAEVDGKVGAIYDAPAGGKYMMIGGQRHFVHAGFEPKVKTGDTVAAGDVVSDGLPNPSKIVEHKGIGEGRRYFVDVIRQVYKDSGLKVHRRNLELLGRGLINHVELDDEIGDFVPGDVVPYDILASQYTPREGHSIVSPKNAVGKYLEKPILHYTIGTKIQPDMVKQLNHFNVANVLVHNDPPVFRPKMIQARYNMLHDQDWMTRQLGSELKKGLLRGAHHGATSDELGTSFVPGLARAEEFGRVGQTKGWEPSKVIKTTIPKPEQDQFDE